MRRQLSTLVAAVAAAVVIAFVLPLALLVRTLAEDRAMSAATQEAHSVAVIAAVEHSAQALRPVIALVNQRSTRRTTVFFADGSTEGSPAPRTAAVASAFHGSSFVTYDGENKVLLVPVSTGEGVIVVQTWVPETLLRQGVAASWAILGTLGAGVLCFAILAADRIGRRIVRPILDLADAAHRLTTGDLGARVTPAGTPEVRALGETFNRVVRRVSELLQAEREMVADLSHRLRTPITALRLDADSLRDPDESGRLAAHIEVLERTVNDVIQEARRPVREGVNASTDATAVVRARVAFWEVLAEDQGRPLTLELPSVACEVRVSGEDLTAAVDALLHNVFQHTEDTTAMYVSLRKAPAGGAVLVVADDGLGFPDDRVETRGRSSAGSSGLGLDIVRRTAEASGGHVRLATSRGGGAFIEVTLGSPG
jgi:signal transduction histidine kinase